ncbi:hypothetical protein T4B_10758 [Trichinella pseudospiralis]|uniref:Uncharacterized protein n=1 Tax=Trichinella pseudospiralis TaxID=6337 RepID=A0A0V1IKP0_TRIPS|nr:hypothetical protein T4B_10758 [Trichinella pseudospiralis]
MPKHFAKIVIIAMTIGNARCKMGIQLLPVVSIFVAIVRKGKFESPTLTCNFSFPDQSNCRCAAFQQQLLHSTICPVSNWAEEEFTGDDVEKVRG